MCQNAHYFYNRYIRQSVLVPCGKCPSCQQKKAVYRANRIVNHSAEGYINLFVTLTYENRFVPYVLKDDVNDGTVNIYRDASVRMFRGRKYITYGTEIIDQLVFTDSDHFCEDNRRGLKSLKNYSDRVGICYYKDAQDFFKRLRIYLKRNYEYKDISYYCCSEYGSKSHRPHLHCVIRVRTDFEEIVRRAVVSCWCYADSVRTSKFVQVARNCSSYVASYVNCGADFPPFLKTASIRQKHSYSQGYGCGLRCFTLPAILEKVERGDLHYNVRKVKDGVPVLSKYVIPEYVGNRYFPKIMGYRLFTDSEILEHLLCPKRLCRLYNERMSGITYLNDDEIYRFCVHIRNCIDRYVNITGKTEFDYVIDYTAFWRLYSSTMIKDSFADVKRIDDLSDHYENINELDLGFVSSDLSYFLGVIQFEYNPLHRKDIISSDYRMSQMYDKCSKTKYIVNAALSERYDV